MMMMMMFRRRKKTKMRGRRQNTNYKQHLTRRASSSCLLTGTAGRASVRLGVGGVIMANLRGKP